MLTALLLTTLGQAPGLLDPLEEALDKYSFGPTVAAHALVDKNGAAPAFAAGVAVISWDIEKQYEATCVAHREREREQLGVEDTPLGGIIGKAQQECPVIGEEVKGAFEFGTELEVAVRTERELAWRTHGTFLNVYRTLAAGSLISLAFAERSGQTEVGVRLGLAVSYRWRFGKKGFRPALEAFVLGEAAIINRAQLTDQVGLGVRFLYDL